MINIFQNTKYLPQDDRVSCYICKERKNIADIVQQRLHAEYFEAFNFYFAKGINEILANLNISHVILFKDYLFYDDDSEYLKRYYHLQEVAPRFNLLADFYTYQYKQTRPNLCTISASKIINKRNNKFAMLFNKKQERMLNLQNDQNNTHPNNSELVCHNELPLNNLLNGLDLKTNPSHSSIDEIDRKTNNSFMDEFHRQEPDTSYATSTFDIYHPSFSTNNKEQVSLPNHNVKKQNIECRENNLFELQDSIYVKNPNISIHGDFIMKPSSDMRDSQVFNELSDIDSMLPSHLREYVGETLIKEKNTNTPRDDEKYPQKQIYQNLLKEQIRPQLNERILKLPLTNDNTDNNLERWKQPPLSARNHFDVKEDLRKKIIAQEKINAINRDSENKLNNFNQFLTKNSNQQNQNNFYQSSNKQQNPNHYASSAEQSGEIAGSIVTPRDIQSASRNNSQFLSHNSQSYGSNRKQQGDKQNPQDQQQMCIQQISKSQKQSFASVLPGNNLQKSGGLLQRLPLSIQQQLTLKLPAQQSLKNDFKLNQNPPDCIWTDRDVNPRLAVNPQKERPTQQNQVFIGQGEVKQLKAGKIFSRPQSNNHDIIGNLSDRVFLKQIQEQPFTQQTQRKGGETPKELPQKIIQQALSHQISKANSQSNIQDVYRKYQMMVEEHNQNSNNRSPHDQQGIRTNGQQLSFVRPIQHRQEETNVVKTAQYKGRMQEEREDESTNLTNQIKASLIKSKQNGSDDLIPTIHKPKIKTDKITANHNQNMNSANSLNNNMNSSHFNNNNANSGNGIGKISINNSSSQTSNHTSIGVSSSSQQQLPKRSMNKTQNANCIGYSNVSTAQNRSSANYVVNNWDLQQQQQLQSQSIPSMSSSLLNNKLSIDSKTHLNNKKSNPQGNYNEPNQPYSNVDNQYLDQLNKQNRQNRTGSLIRKSSSDDNMVFNKMSLKKTQPKLTSPTSAIVFPQAILSPQRDQLNQQDNMMFQNNKLINKSQTIKPSKQQQSHIGMHQNIQYQYQPQQKQSNKHENSKKIIFANDNSNINNNIPIHMNNNLSMKQSANNSHHLNSAYHSIIANNLSNQPARSTQTISHKSYQDSHQNSLDKQGSNTHRNPAPSLPIPNIPSCNINRTVTDINGESRSSNQKGVQIITTPPSIAGIAHNKKQSSPNHKKKQMSQSLSKSNQKVHNQQPQQITSIPIGNLQIPMSNIPSSIQIVNVGNVQQNLGLQSSTFNVGKSQNMQKNPISNANTQIPLANIQMASPSIVSMASPVGIGQDISQQHNVKGLSSKKQDLKLNISKIIQQQQHQQQLLNMQQCNSGKEDLGENSYGFWTSRSTKQQQSLQSSQKYPSFINSSNKGNWTERNAQQNVQSASKKEVLHNPTQNQIKHLEIKQLKQESPAFSSQIIQSTKINPVQNHQLPLQPSSIIDNKHLKKTQSQHDDFLNKKKISSPSTQQINSPAPLHEYIIKPKSFIQPDNSNSNLRKGK